MSITLSTYVSADGMDAEIRLNKGSAAPELLITLYGSTVYRNTYLTRAGARRAMNRFASTWTRT